MFLWLYEVGMERSNNIENFQDATSNLNNLDMIAEIAFIAGNKKNVTSNI
jgi:hypothetical protein